MLRIEIELWTSLLETRGPNHLHQILEISKSLMNIYGIWEWKSYSPWPLDTAFFVTNCNQLRTDFWYFNLIQLE